MNISKRARAVIAHDRAEIEAERLEQELRGETGRSFLDDLERWKVARAWLSWAKRELMRHGAKGE